MESSRIDIVGMNHRPIDRWTQWPVYWTAIWVGVLALIGVGVLFGLAGTALGAHEASPGTRIVRWADVGFLTMAFSVISAFVSAAVGGWVAARIAGIYRPETAMLHGAIVWLLAIPLMLVMAALGGSMLLGGWYGGMAGTPMWAPTAAVVDPNAAIAARNAALATITVLLIGLLGAVVGAWLGSYRDEHVVAQERDADITERRVA
jgi:hypothetical protein